MQIEKVVRRLYGKPCWGVKPGLGSFLTLEFGKPNLEVRDPIVASKGASAKVRERLARRGVYVYGEWHLWIYCCDWEVLSGSKCIGNSSTQPKIRRAAEFLNGQKLTGFSISPRRVSCVFEFDLGAALKTRPYDKEGEQWLLYGPSHKVLTLRADGRYQYMRDDVPGDQGRWKPMVGQDRTAVDSAGEAVAGAVAASALLRAQRTYADGATGISSKQGVRAMMSLFARF